MVKTNSFERTWWDMEEKGCHLLRCLSEEQWHVYSDPWISQSTWPTCVSSSQFPSSLPDWPIPTPPATSGHLVLWWQAVFGEFYLSIASETIQPIVVSKVTTISIETWGCATILVIAKSKCYLSRGIRVARANKWLHFSTETKSREITTKLNYSCFAKFLGNIK